MKKWHLYLFTYLAVLLIGGLIGYNIDNKNKPPEPEFTKPDTVETHTVVPCSVGYPVPFKITDTLIVYMGDTVEAIKTEFLDSTYTWVDNRKLWQDFDMRILSKEPIFGYTMFFNPRQYKWTPLPEKPFKFYGSVAGMIDIDKILMTEIECGLTFKKRISLFGRIAAESKDNILEVKSLFGIKVSL